MGDVKQKDLPKVSVIIPIRNEEKYIGKCLQSMVDQDYPRDLIDILVIDGRSEDNSRKVVNAFAIKYNNMRVLDNPKQNQASAMNIGIKETFGDVLIRVDGHCHVARDFVRRNIEYLEKTNADCVGGPIKTISNSFMGNMISLAMSSPFGVGNATFRYSEREQYVDTLAFGCYRRRIFERIGLYDEELLYGEDDELNLRLIKNGGKIFLTPKIRSYYYCRSSLCSLWRQYYNYGYGKVRTLKKHKRLASWRHFIPVTFVLSIVSGLLFWTVNPIFGGLLVSILSSYLGLSIFTSAKIALKKGWKYFFVLPTAFGTIHFSYGIGFLHGILNLINFERAGNWIKNRIRWVLFNQLR